MLSTSSKTALTLALVLALTIFINLLPTPTVQAAIEGMFGIPNNAVLSITKDQKGNYWFGTTSGLAKMNGVRWTYYQRSDGLPAQVVYDLVTLNDGSVWAGTDVGLVRWQEQDQKFEIFQHDFRAVYRLQDLNGDLWFSSDHGIQARLASGSFDYLIPNSRASTEPWLDQALAITKDAQNYLWAGNLKLYSYDASKKAWASYKSPRGFPPTITALLAATNNGLWVGTSQGLGWFQYGNDQWEFVSERGAPQNAYVYDLQLDDQGGLWVGTNQGAYYRNFTGNWRHLGQNNGLKGQQVFNIFLEADGTIWFSTNQGATRLIGNDAFTFQEKNFFNDIEAVAWAKPYIRSLYVRGIATGFPDGTFRPANNITRAEVLKLGLVAGKKRDLVEAADIKLPTDLQDVTKDSWQATYVSYALKHQVMALPVANFFRPDAPARRIDALQAVLAAFDLALLDTTTSRFTDVAGEQLRIAETGVVFGLVGGRTATTFVPDDLITRAEFAKILEQAIRLKD